MATCPPCSRKVASIVACTGYPDTLWQALFYLLAKIHQQLNTQGDYIVDSCPVPVCDNLRIRRCKLYHGEDYRGIVPANAATSTD